MKVILILFFISITSFCVAQDVIYKKDKTKIDAKVLEIGTSEVKYKPTSNPDGPLYSVSKSDIATIVFQNGTFEIFSSESNSRKRVDSLSINFCRNYIGVDIGQFVVTSIAMHYEHVFGKKGFISLGIPFSTGIGSRNYGNNYPYGKIFATGLDVKYFPTGQGAFRYFAAPYFEWGIFKYSYYSYYSQYPYPYYEYYNGQHFAGGIKNGIQYQPTKHFCFTSDFGFGIKKDETHYANESIEPHFQANIIIGYRF